MCLWDLDRPFGMLPFSTPLAGAERVLDSEILYVFWNRNTTNDFYKRGYYIKKCTILGYGGLYIRSKQTAPCWNQTFFVASPAKQSAVGTRQVSYK